MLEKLYIKIIRRHRKEPAYYDTEQILIEEDGLRFKDRFGYVQKLYFGEDAWVEIANYNHAKNNQWRIT